ncbi:MAG: hypothetical protein WBM45_05010, partial [Woeseiaceae bacterium]
DVVAIDQHIRELVVTCAVDMSFVSISSDDYFRNKYRTAYETGLESTGKSGRDYASDRRQLLKWTRIAKPDSTLCNGKFPVQRMSRAY